MKKIVMFVYGTIATDARVQRAAACLARNFEVILLSVRGKSQVAVGDGKYSNIFIDCGFQRKEFKLFSFLSKCFELIKREKPDIVYAHDYYSTLLVYFLLRRRKRPKLIYDAHELIIPNAHYNVGRRLKFFGWFEKRIVNKVDLLVCASQERGELMKKHYRLKDNPLVVRNISQLTTCFEIENDVLKERLNEFFVKPGLTLVYAGAITKERMVDKLLDVAVDLIPTYKLLIIGDGGYLEELKSKIEKYPSLTCMCTGALPYRVLGSVLRRCDVGYVYYPADIDNNIYCASNKVYEYASISLPMLSNRNPTLVKIFEVAGIGVACEDYKQGLMEIAMKKDQMKHNCEVFTKNNKWENESEILLRSVSSL